MKKITLVTIVILCMSMCSHKSMVVQQIEEVEMIRVVVQPTVEINKEIIFEIFFNGMPEKGSFQMGNIDGLEVSRHNVFGMSGFSVTKKEDGYSFDTSAKTTKLGKIEIPSVSAIINGVEYKSKPFSINVVDSIAVNSNSVRTVLVPNKNTYSLQDTIIVSLLKYSKFSNAREKNIPDYFDFTLYHQTEIENIDEYPNEDLEWIDFKWGLIDELPRKMGQLDGEDYIISEVYRFYYLANKKGKYTCHPSVLEFSIHKSTTDFIEQASLNAKESDEKIDHSYKLTVTSNPIEIIVE